MELWEPQNLLVLLGDDRELLSGGALSAGGGATDSCQSQSWILRGDMTHTLVFEEKMYDGTDGQ